MKATTSTVVMWKDRWANVWPEPGVERGRFKVLPRTDGKFTVYDPLLPLGRRQVGEAHKTVELATHACEDAACMHPGRYLP
jgi:hypothetical protein